MIGALAPLGRFIGRPSRLRARSANRLTDWSAGPWGYAVQSADGQPFGNSLDDISRALDWRLKGVATQATIFEFSSQKINHNASTPYNKNTKKNSKENTLKEVKRVYISVHTEARKPKCLKKLKLFTSFYVPTFLLQNGINYGLQTLKCKPEGKSWYNKWKCPENTALRNPKLDFGCFPFCFLSFIFCK